MSIPTLAFGRTGHESTRVVFGGAALARATQDVADRALEVLLRYGVNHIDVAASYGDAELRIKPWLRDHPNRFFLATKTGRRTAQGAREEIKKSYEEYVEQVGKDFAESTSHFKDALNEILAGGQSMF